jgi:hypothetical protein
LYKFLDLCPSLVRGAFLLAALQQSLAESLVLREHTSIEPDSTTQLALHQDDILREVSVDELQHHCSISGAKECAFLDHGWSPDNISIKHLDSVGFTLFCPE